MLRLWVHQNANMPRRLPAAPGKQFAIPQDANGTALFEVDTGPLNNAAEWANVGWTVNGAGAVPIQQGKQLSIPINNTGPFAVTATYQGLQETITLWVIWANLQIHDNGNLPAGCQIDFSTSPINTNPTRLGVEHGVVQGNPEAVGRICAQATMAPAGINQFLTTNLRIRRQIVIEKTWQDANLRTVQNTPDNTNNPNFKQWVLDNADRIFDLDAPNIAWFGAQTIASVETYIHFQQWVEFAGVACSNVADWHFIGEFLTGTPATAIDANPAAPPQILQSVYGQNPVVHRAVVSAGPLNVGGINQPRYVMQAFANPNITLENHGQRP